MNGQRAYREDSFFAEEGKTAFTVAIVAGILLHATIVLGIVAFSSGASLEPEFTPLAIVDFSSYDPAGGEPDGGPMEEPAQPETAPEPVPEAPAPSEPDEPPELAEDVVTTVAKDAVEEIPPPPKPEKKKAPKPKPRPKPKMDPPARPTTGQLAANPSTGSSVSSSGGEGRGGSGGGTGQGNPDALNAYYAQIRKKLARYQKYPSAARSRRQEGVATVVFVVDRQGKVLSSKLVKSSNHSLLDEEVLALLKRVDPFPPAPREVGRDRFELTIPIRFELSRR